MKEEIAISVLIPAYNAEKYIEKCLKSITEQSLKNIEIIVVNDGSIDRTLEILEKLKNEDNRIKIITQKNQGVSSARNNALKYARGEYILWIDADDWLEDGLEELYVQAKKEKVDILVMDYWREEKGKKIYIKDEIKENNIEYINEIILGKSTGYLWNKLIKTSIYKLNDINFSEKIRCGEDKVNLIKLLYFAKKIKKINKAYYYYVFNSESLSKKKYNNEDIFLKVLPDYINQIEELESYFFNNEEIKISNLKVLNGLWYFIKNDAFYNPIFILKKENEKIIKYFLEGVKKGEIDKISSSNLLRLMLKNLRIFNTKYVLVAISIIGRLKKYIK